MEWNENEKQVYEADEPSLGEKAEQRANEMLEDVKGAIRRTEGAVTNNQAMEREHEPSTLEKVGESIIHAGEYVRDTVYEGAVKIGLVDEKPSDQPFKQYPAD